LRIKRAGRAARRNHIVAPQVLFFPGRLPFARGFARACTISVLILASCGLLAGATAPPTGENAYCEKGNIAKFGDKDGPAELPKACYYTGLDGTPSPGKQTRVPSGGNLTSAIDGAKCGDTLLLQAGASFDVSELPAKKCDDQHYITVRTDTPDSKLPPEGTRISPAWAGVGSLAGRPKFAQPAGGPAKLMATLMVRRPAGVTVGDHIRFIGIEFTTDPTTNIGRMVSMEGTHHVVIDRSWIHPGEGAEVGKGVGMVQGAHHIAVINSYLSGMNCVARSGKCTDASAVGGGNGDLPTGTFKIVNNFLEASGENVFFGGSGATVNPTDIEIRRNHLFRPMTWKEGEPGYAPSPSGNPYIVKNHMELKNALRLLFEGNLLQNSWGGFSQTGHSICLNPRNQANKCPKCRVLDITIRFNRIRNVAGVFSISNSLSKTGGDAADGGRYSIHDVIADNLHQQDYKGGGSFLSLLSVKPPLHDVHFDHVTGIVRNLLIAILDKGEKIDNFSMTNSVFVIGDRRPPLASAGGGPENCATKTQKRGPEAVLNECFTNYKFDKNMIIGGRQSWPAGILTVSSPEAAAFRDLKDGISADPRLCRAKGANCSKVSPGAGAALGGRDLGADVDAVEAAIAGVE
jgi:hypothetical protein